MNRLFLICILVILVAGCSNQNTDATQLNDIVRMEEIKPYLEQWDANKDKITRLSEIESELLMLVQALSLQADLETVPENMRTGVKLVEHGTSEQNIQETAQTTLTTPQQSTYAVNLGSYLKKDLAILTSQRLQKAYPLIFKAFQYKVNTLSKPNIVLHQLIAGPFNNKQDAIIFCRILSKIDLACKLSPFAGENV
ncbi:hypothetical protein PTRA_a0851 [Pseudoalteromonas translucida KMM 520]|uniref:SPOR domain-containing protein n=1 Tax=Pseudoalteromonas translucida KMM 520 TaxID=1315283 RepID=A0A0U2WJS3_9GAMM|nr:hypothetical protein [Pseudoalteromonas translucida]ALS32155.1 hypothetical protein PTRA_a0851 [Pseudoalteromonas translucida KMM 520]